MGGYLKEDRVRASSLGSISVSKYGGFCYCRALFSRPATDQGENWRIGKGRAGEGKSERWEKVEGRQLKKRERTRQQRRGRSTIKIGSERYFEM